MRIDLVYPTLPPALNGIGDYTAHMAQALAEQGATVRILTEGTTALAHPDVEIVPAFTVAPRSGVRGLVDAVEAAPPDWLILQFEQFSYGRWGLNPYLPLTLATLHRRLPETRLALMAHEDFASVAEGPKFAVMSLWQRPQFWALGRLADHVFLSIDAWAQKYRSWFPNVPVDHLPVGSNIPRGAHTRAEARSQFQLPPEAFMVGLFGSAHPSRQLDRVGAVLSHLRSLRPNVEALYVGASGSAVRAALPADVPLHDVGPLPAEDVSTCFSAMDLYLSPFRHGVSTRRGSFLVGIQHGVPTLSTSGQETDALLHAANGEAFVLAPWADAAAFRTAAERLVLDAEVRRRLGRAGERFFETTFSWARLARQLIAALTSSPAATAPTRAETGSAPTPHQSAAAK
jgi:glycosyltransferase involved in cell wall biosynthesis